MTMIGKLTWALAAAVGLAACSAGEPAADTPGTVNREAETETHAASFKTLVDGHVRLYAVDRYENVRRLDPDTLAVLDVVDTGPRPHGIVASPDGRLLYVTLETTNEVLKIDVATHEILARVEVGPIPNEPALTPDGRFLVVPQRGGDGADVVDTAAMTVLKTLPTGEQGHNAYTSPDGRRVFSTSMGENLISVIDVASWEIERRIPVGGVPRPVALTADGRRAYVALSGLIGFVTVDLETDRVVERLELPIPDGTPPPPLDTYTHGLLLTPDQRELWVAAYATRKVYAYLVPEGHQLAEIEVGGGPHWFTLHPDGEPLYVSLEREGKVAAIHRGIRQVLRVGSVGQAPTRILAFRTMVASKPEVPS